MKPVLSLRPVALVVAVALAAATLPAAAYVGPGAGLSLLNALWALIAAVAAAIGFLVLWPLRRMMKKRAQAAMSTVEAPPTDPGAPPHHPHDGPSR